MRVKMADVTLEMRRAIEKVFMDKQLTMWELYQILATIQAEWAEVEAKREGEL